MCFCDSQFENKVKQQNKKHQNQNPFAASSEVFKSCGFHLNLAIQLGSNNLMTNYPKNPISKLLFVRYSDHTIKELILLMLDQLTYLQRS